MTNMTEKDFVESVQNYKPDSIKCENNFTRDGLEHLYYELIEESYDTGRELDLDPARICDQYKEYENIKAAADDLNVSEKSIKNSSYDGFEGWIIVDTYGL